MDSSNTNVVEANRVGRFALRGAIGFGLGAIVAGIGASSAGLFATLCGVLSGAVGGALLGWRRKTRRSAWIAAFGFGFGFVIPGLLGIILLIDPQVASSNDGLASLGFAWGLLLAVAGAIGAPFLSSGRTIITFRSLAFLVLAGGLAFGIGGTIGGVTAFTLFPRLVVFLVLFYGLSFCIGGALLGAALGYSEGRIAELKDEEPRGPLSTPAKIGLVKAAAVLGTLSVPVYLVFVVFKNGLQLLVFFIVGVQAFDSEPILMTSAVFSPDGTQILTGSMDNTAKLWDAATGRKIRTYTGHGPSPFMMSDGMAKAMGKEVVAAARADTEANPLTGVFSVAFSPDGKQVLTGARDYTAKLWDKETGQEIRTFSGHRRVVTSVAFSPDGLYVLTGSNDYMAKLWDKETGQDIRTFPHSAYVASVAFSPDGLYVLTGSMDNMAKLWDTKTGDEIRTIALGETVSYSGYALHAVFSPDGARVLTAGEADTVKLWDAATGKEVQNFAGHTGAVISVAFSPDGTQVLTGSVDNSAKLWDVTTGDEVRTYAGVRWAAFSPDGTQILTINRNFRRYNRVTLINLNDRDNTVTLLDAATGDEVWTSEAIP